MREGENIMKANKYYRQNDPLRRFWKGDVLIKVTDVSYGTVYFVRVNKSTMIPAGRTSRFDESNAHLFDEVKVAPPKAKKIAKTELDHIMCDFVSLACGLSPENLHCDGEASTDHVNRTFNHLTREWRKLEAKMGRTVEEEEAWDWSSNNREYRQSKKSYIKPQYPGLADYGTEVR
jgi:hypothetical protein